MVPGVALAALGVVVAGATFTLARDDDPSPPTTTSTTTTGIDATAAAGAVAEALEDGLAVPLTAAEARCLAAGLIELVPVDDLDDLSERAEPLTGVAPEVRQELVRVIVGCVPEPTAAALLGSASTTTVPLDLPDEG